MKKNIKYLLPIFIGTLMSLSDFVLAFELQYPKIFGLTLNDTSTLPEYARYFFSFGIAISAMVSMIVIIFGGIYFLISRGAGKYTDEGKAWFKAGLLGLFLILCSYLIVYTINPALAIFRMNGLSPVVYTDPIPEIISPFTPKVIYSEIPIGILTENTLSRSISCYDFDFSGDPVYAQIKTDGGEVILGPGLIDRDRTDCAVKLAAAAEKKAKIIKLLSDEISKLMQTCKCETAVDEKGNKVCDQNCSKDEPCDKDEKNGECGKNGNPNTGDPCSGDCSKKPCKFSDKTKANDCCPINSGVKNPKNPKKNLSVKELIEYGPIKINPAGCGTIFKEYKGLDEFRNLRSDISSIVETKEIEINGHAFKVIDQAKWNQLKVTEQLLYIQEKLDDIKSKIKNDSENLDKAKNELSKCYLATPYIDFLKIYEQNNPKDRLILKNKTYSDQTSKTSVDISKYCSGFSYGDSACFNICQNVCPGNSQEDLSCYKNCPKCDPGNIACLNNQRVCIEKCYNKRKCLTNPNYGNFEGCISYCRGKCAQDCANKYPSCSPEFTACFKKCGNDSKCLIENESKCIFNPQQIRNCVEANNNPYYLNNCMDISYLCKNGSDQNAGYPECLTAPYSTDENYSSSFIFQHWNYQICPNPYALFNPYSTSKETCADMYPKTEKCPSSSSCPSCPCGLINEKITITTSASSPPITTGSPGICQTSDPSKPGYCPGGGKCVAGKCTYGSSAPTSSSYTETINQYNVVLGQCNEFSYNDDPLTFYCKESWWIDQNETKAEPIGQERYCSESNEIPIGKTIDDTSKWAQSLIKKIDDTSKKIGEMIDYVKKIGNENSQSYCKCDSVCEGGRPCQTSCTYQQVSSKGDKGETVKKCACTLQLCKGVSCQKMINYLDGGKTESCPAEQDGVGIYYDKINKSSKELYIFLSTQNRSDILKELEYSRKKTSQCSLIKNLNGDEAKIISCKRVEDEIIPPIGDSQTIVDGKIIKAHCYGQNLEKFGISGITDNWFCCEKR